MNPCQKNNAQEPEHEYMPKPCVANIPCAAQRNQRFRTAFWTGRHLQMTLMEIPVCCDIGLEIHPETDQFLRVEAGQATVRMGTSRDDLCIHARLCPGDGVFVPCGTWHNIINTGVFPLKLTSIYAPPQHPYNTAQATKAEKAEKESG